MELNDELGWLERVAHQARLTQDADAVSSALAAIEDRRALWQEAELNELISTLGHRQLTARADELVRELQSRLRP